MPFTRFFVAMGVQLAAILALLALIAPHMFSAEAHQPWKILLWTALLGLPMSLFEYFYHRYLLHSAVLPFMASMHRAHSTHHGLTYVKAPVTPKEPAKLVEVTSEFPVEEKHQEESMMFPLWSLPIFIAVFMVLFALPLKLIFPAQPVLISLILAVTAYYMSYEVWHAVLHLPYERFWQPAMEGRWTKRLFRRMYSFHLMHHWRPTSNLAIVGFWGVAVWDYAFRTHRRPERLPLDGAEVNYNDAKLAKPLWPIALLDRWQAGLYKASRATERFLARVFLRRPA
ncbi:MAG: hypothetical protein ACHQ50_06600 [Fimbriimonadales bacterium]